MFFLWSLVIGLAAASSARSSDTLDCTGINGIRPQCEFNESSYKRDVFWVGGHYVNAAIGLLTYDQMYVEKMTPNKGRYQKAIPLGLISYFMVEEFLEQYVAIFASKQWEN